jgi:DNA polymerase V
MNRVYICIDLKSFYASVECVERGLDPLDTNLVVADLSRTEKTICLAITPSLKQYGLSGRSRLYEVIQKVNQINYERKKNVNKFEGESYLDSELKNNPKFKLSYIVAPPRMNYYMKYSSKIYSIYLKYLAPEDIYVYSIDEVFCDITNYLKLYKSNPKDLVTKIIKDVYETTGITATAGIGTNMYLAKIAMDIVAKHEKANAQGVRIASLDEKSYREILWKHKPLTDFWRVGKGISKKLEENNMHTMGDIALCSIENENKLFKLFGINAELLIDHAWGYEPCTIKDIKSYKPTSNSLSSGQVLHEPYDYKKAKLIVKEMSELLSLDVLNNHYVTDTIVLNIGYDISNLNSNKIPYDGEITKDFYGRLIPKPAHGTVRLDHKTSSTKLIISSIIDLYDKIINKDLLVRRINIAACNLIKEYNYTDKKVYKQFDLFSNNELESINKEKELKDEKIDNEIQRTIISIKRKYGKNAILKGMNLEEGGTTISRNKQVGGHQG